MVDEDCTGEMETVVLGLRKWLWVVYVELTPSRVAKDK